MGANEFEPVPVPIGDGVGAPVGVTEQGLKTFIIGGTFNSDNIIEAGIGGNFAPLFVPIDKPRQFRDIPIIADEVRVRVVNSREDGQAIIFVGGAPVVTQFGTIIIPTADGEGPVLDISLFGSQKTIIVGGEFNAKISFEISEDVGGPFAPIDDVDKPNNLICKSFVARFIRAVVSNYVDGVPTAGIGGADLIGGASVFGNDYQSVANPTRITTAGAMFVTHSTLVTPALTGTYRIYARALVDSGANMQCRLQNVTDGAQIGGRGEYSPLLSSDRILWSATRDVVFTGAPKTFSTQFRDDPPPGATAGMSFSFIDIWRVS